MRSILLSSLRQLRRHPFESTIHLAGLSAALTCCLFLALYLDHELQFDMFHPNRNQLVRVTMEYGFQKGEINGENVTSARVLPEFKRRFPEVENGVRLMQNSKLVRNGDIVFIERRVLLTDPQFFQVFPGFHLEKGHPEMVLNQPHNIVLTATVARKYFGTQDPIGKTLQVSADQIPYTVSGVAADCPSASQIQFDILLPFESLAEQENTWWNANYTTYLSLQPGTSPEKFEAKTTAFLQTEMKSSPGTSMVFHYEPFAEVHLYSPYASFVAAGNARALGLMALVGGMILAIAACTYLNLSTSRAMERAREVGVRKVAGAGPWQLRLQFLGEAMVLCFLALGLALALVALGMPYFSRLSQVPFEPMAVLEPRFLLSALGITFLLGISSGFYPAVVLSAYEPGTVLKGQFSRSASGYRLLRVLLGLQFGISFFLLCCTLVVRNQFEFIQKKPMGYNREQVVVLSLDQKLMEKTDILKAELQKMAGVQHVSFSYESPVTIRGGYGVSTTARGAYHNVNANPVDEGYLSTMHLELVAGENLSTHDVAVVHEEDTLPDTYAFLLNETCCRMLGWTAETAIGKKIYLGEQRPGLVKGVVRDFHYASLHQPIEALILFPGGWRNTALLKVSAPQWSGLKPQLETLWKKHAPYRPFEFHFLEEDFQDLYTEEDRTRTLFGLFSGLALGMAALGLLGLSTHAARQRIKEIGIRKVLGATRWELTALLCKNFLILVVVASLVAFPLAWWTMKTWLESFSYRIDVGPEIFLSALGAMLSLTLATVGYQALKAAGVNPAHSLRTE
jgi:putative ABC transport system permease protein